MVARQALPKDDDELDDLGFVLNGHRDGAPAKIDVGLTKDKQTIVFLTRVQQAKTGPRKQDTELRIPLDAIKKALRYLDPPDRLVLPGDDGLNISLDTVPARTVVPGVPMTADELQIGGVPVEDDFVPPSA